MRNETVTIFDVSMDYSKCPSYIIYLMIDKSTNSTPDSSKLYLDPDTHTLTAYSSDPNFSFVYDLRVIAMIYGFEYRNISIDLNVTFLPVIECSQTLINVFSIQY